MVFAFQGAGSFCLDAGARISLPVNAAGNFALYEAETAENSHAAALVDVFAANITLLFPKK